MTTTHTRHGTRPDQRTDIVGLDAAEPDTAQPVRPLTLVPHMPTLRPHQAPPLPAIGLPGGIELAASAEPAIVFASLASHAVTELCDHCVIDIQDDAGHAYRLAYPPTATVGSGVDPHGDPTAPRMLRLEFTAPPDTDNGDAHNGSPSAEHGYHGIAIFQWRRRSPAHADRLIAELFIEQALRTVAWQRSEQHARDAVERAHHLDIALHTSRQIGAAIGILMSTHKITETQAFDLLRLASQHSHRKLRELALDVIDTGWLDPTLVGDARSRHP